MRHTHPASFRTLLAGLLALATFASPASLAAGPGLPLFCKTIPGGPANLRCCTGEPTWWCDEPTLIRQKVSACIMMTQKHGDALGSLYQCRTRPAQAPESGAKTVVIESQGADIGQAPVSTSSTRLTFETLQAFVEKRNADRDPARRIQSVPALMKALKAGEFAGLSEADQTALFRKWTAIYQSQSRQAASAERPRILMRTEDTRFLMAYTGETGPQSRSLELIQLNDQTKAWEFAEIDFPGEGTAGASVVFRKHGSGTQAQACTGCHLGRPNWHAYRLWPGVFKGNDDSTEPGSQEHLARRKFEARVEGGQDPDYAFLSTHLFGAQGAPTTNTSISIGLSRANFERIARILANSPRFPQYQYALMAAVTNCSDIESFVPVSARSRHPLAYAKLLQSTHSAHSGYYEDRRNALGDNFDPATTARDIEVNHATRVAALRYLAQGLELTRPGDRIEDWSMVPLNGDVFAFQAGFFGINRLDQPLAREIVARTPGPLAFVKEMSRFAHSSDTALGGYSEPELTREYLGTGPGCVKLRELSQRALGVAGR